MHTWLFRDHRGHTFEFIRRDIDKKDIWQTLAERLLQVT